MGLEIDLLLCVPNEDGNRLYVLYDLHPASGILALAFYSESEYQFN